MKTTLLKIICFNLLLLFCSTKATAQCSPGDLTFTTQAQINAFATTYSACSTVTLGNLTIGYISGVNNSDITDLTPLQKISSLTGNLIVRRNPSLNTLNGLQNIASFSGDLRLDTNVQLQNITALSGITSARYLNIRDNAVLQNLTGLHNLTAIIGSGSSGYFYLFNNPQLTNLDAFQSLTSVGTYIQVQNNALLQNLDGLGHVTSIGTNIHIENNAVLSSILGLQNIPATLMSGTTGLLIRNNNNLSVCNLPNFCAYLANPSSSHPRTITGNKTTCLDVAAVTANCAVVCPTGDLTFTTQDQVNAFGATYAHCTNMTVNSLTIGPYSGSSNISDLTPLHSIVAIQNVMIVQRTQLQNLNGLNNLKTVASYVSFFGNSVLNNFTGLSSLQSIGGNLSVESNTTLQNFTGLSSLTSIGGNLYINSNNALLNLNGLSALSSLGGTLTITVNNSLLNLNGLSSLNSITGALTISGNSALNNISGLSNIGAANITLLNIANNTNLSVCNLPNFCAYLANPSSSHPRTITGNKTTCLDVAAVSLACNVACPTGDLTFTTQNQVNYFGATYAYCTNLTLNSLTIGYISGINNSDITDLTPLQKISSLTGNLTIRRNPNLTTLNGLQNITSFSGDLRLDTNAQLQNITALSGITSVRYLNVRDNAVLQNLTGLQNLTAIIGTGSSGYFYLFNNPQLTNLDAFQSLTSVGTYIQIQNNALLQNLDGLSHVTSISTNIQIDNNAVLSSIWGLRNIPAAAISGTIGLLIRNNSNLSVCNLPNFCAYLANPSSSHSRTITGNKTTCLDVAAVTANCIPCNSPTNVTVANMNSSSADLTWQGDGNVFDIEWGLQGFALGTGIRVTGLTTAHYTIAGLNTNSIHDFYVRQVCTDSANGQSDWVKHTFVYDYCKPVSNPNSAITGTIIDSFTTTGGITNINNLNSGYSSLGYGDFKATHSISLYPGNTVSFSAVPLDTDYNAKAIRIWVDINKNGIFETSEIMYTSPSTDIYTLMGSFILPSAINAGNYVMRVILKYNSTQISPCEVNFYGEAEDYTLNVLVPLPCQTVSAVTATNLTEVSATINWTGTSSLFDVEWGLSGFTLGTGTQQTGVTSTSYQLTELNFNTKYDFYVRQDCTNSADGYSYWSKCTFVSRDYCNPTSYSGSPDYGFIINSFTTTGGITNINNLNSGYSQFGGNFTGTHSISQYAGETISFSAVSNENIVFSKVIRIWVDINKNGIFETSETMYTSPSAVGTGALTGSFILPSAINAGNYRMRVIMRYDNTSISPCQFNFYGEAEDYTLTILPCQTVSTFTTTNVTGVSATMNWTSTSSLFEIEWGLSGFTLGTGTQQTGITTTSYDLTGLNVNTEYDFYIRRDCIDSANGYSNWTKYTFVSSDYCKPVSRPDSPAYGYVINSFTTTGGLININNLNSGYSLLGYGDFRATHSIKQYAGETVSFSAVPNATNGNLKAIRIWVDINKNGIFETSEIMYTSPSAIGTGALTGSFILSSAINAGNFVMRVIMKDDTSISPCEVNFFGETEDYTITILNALPCTSVIGLTANSPSLSSAQLNWTSSGIFDIEYGLTGFTLGTGTTITGITATQYTVSGLAEGVYDFYIRKDCTSDSLGYSTWIKISVQVGYCKPVSRLDSPAYGYVINSFTTTGGLTNISNLNSGYSPLGYGDFRATHSIKQHAGETVSFSAVPSGNNGNLKAIRIWVDINKNGFFETSEIMYTSPIAIGTGALTGSFIVPSAINAGNFVMRVIMKDDTSISPCEVNFFGETEDYTITILNALPCTSVIGLTANSPSLSSAQLNWTSSGTFDIEYGLTGFTLGTGTTITGITATQYTVSNLTDGVYDFYIRQNCTSDSLGYGNRTKISLQIGYCKPVTYSGNPNLAIIINSFTTIGGLTNINNLNSGYSPLGYGDFSGTHSISQYPGESVSFSAVPSVDASYYKGVNIWIDINKNGIFEPSEIMYTSPSVVTGSVMGSFVLPSAINTGNYKMRVILKYNSTLISPCEVNFYGEAEDYTLTVLSVLPCTSVIGLTANSPDSSSAQLNWTSSGTFDIEYGLTGFTLGTGATITGITATQYTVSNLTDGAYDFYIRKDCTSGSLDYSNWTKIFRQVGYCIPSTIASSLNDGDYIASFSAEGQNVLNNAASYSTGGYGNFSSTHAISQFVGDTLSFTVVPGGNLYNRGVRIWIDWDKDGFFQTDEIMFTSAALSKLTQTGSFVIPNEQPGNYRMRVILQYDQTTGIGPCDTGFYGEAEDYTLTVLPAGSCVTTTWNGSLWSNGVPNMNRKAIINAALTLGTSLEACELQLTANGKLTIPSGINVTVKGQIVNQASVADLIVASGANLIQIEDVANTGAITVRRNSFPLYRQDYTLWSSPVSSQNLRNFSTQTLFNRFYSYDTEAGTVGEYAQEIFTNSDMQNKVFNAAKGYLIRMPNNWPVFVSNAIDGTSYPGEFTGIPNNGSISIPLSLSNTASNLVGNPYPSSLSIPAFFAANPNIEQTLYFWRKRNGVAGSGYASYNALGFTSPQPEIDVLDLQNTISTGQGFFIRSTGATTLSFNNQMRGNQSGIFLRNGDQNEKHRIWLNLSNATNTISQTLLGYTTGATQNIDAGLDGAYFNDSAIALTSLIGNQEFAIQARSIPFEQSDIVPLGFKTDASGNYIISLFKTDGLFGQDQDVFLKDNWNGQLHDLKASAYSFVTNQGTFNDRFSIVYQSMLGVQNLVFDSNKIIVYKHDTELHVNSGSMQMRKIELFDIRGRLVHTLDEINSNVTKINNLNIASQVLMVRIHSIDNQVAIKKIIF